ncbi:unnamed protein product [Rotaria sordida]|uniref:Pan3 C-terminal knob domain-containing protein n=1 Tax=Rotaria sordida TaxID=392033 RepID=A0A814PRA6_9BILA|nr:unnamed protein product [Rotaria sordida]CAF1320899.1 unnamed protein product [Rotaria sordida]
MSNPSKDHTSIRVHVPPGGHCSNIFGTNPEETHTRAGTIANQYKQTQMKSNIFETDEPAPARSVSNKNKSNVFGSTDDEQNKRQSGVRQGLRDPNASRMGYNPINGESYSMADNLNPKNSKNDKQTDLPIKTNEEENDNAQAISTNSAENSNIQKTVEKPDHTNDGNNAQKNVHTSVRVFQPPGGKSSGPLWMISNGAFDGDPYGVAPFQQGRTFMTPPRNPAVYYNNSSYSQPSIMARDTSLTNSVSGPTNNNSSAYLTDLHSHSAQNKYSHPNTMLGTSRLAHLGVSGPFSSLGPVSSHVDAAALDNNARISPDNNLDFYAYSQAAPYSMQQLTDDDLLISGSNHHEEKERTVPPDMSSVRQARPDFAYFMTDELRAELLRRNQMLTACANLDVAAAMPERVGDYYNLMPLDSSQANVPHKSRTFRYQTISYKATHIRTNAVCYLKRIMGCKLPTVRLYEVVETWKKINHANIAQLREVFLTKDFNDDQPSIVFVYDFIPCCETLQKRHFSSNNNLLKGWSNPYNISGEDRPFSAGKGTNQTGLLAEALIWEYVVQISALIRTLHAASLSCRCLHLSRILVDGDSKAGRAKSRLWLSGVGIADILDGNINANVQQHIQNDLQDFGRLILMLACNSIVGAQKEHLQTSLEIVQRTYSHDLKNLILHFLLPSNTLKTKSINDCMPMIGARFYAHIDNLHVRGDILENELAKELDCGRLFRLICKLNTLLERPEHSMNQVWSETGDRYILKLFRDFIFHSIGFEGEPIMDMAHIVQCLNKFDAGSHDKICLTSRDEQNVMIVSYSELHQAFERAFTELMNYGSTGSS